MTARDRDSPSPRAAGGISGADVQAVSDWLIEQGLLKADFETLIGGFCERVAGAGLPLWRAHVGMRTLHPSIDAIAYTWRRGEGISSGAFTPEESDSEQWRRGPHHAMLEKSEFTLRRRL